MELAKRLTLWLFLVVGVSLAALVWRPIAGESRWIDEISNGELVLVAITLLASAVGYAAMATVGGGLDMLKAVVIGSGVVVLVLALGVYASFSTEPDSLPQATEVESSLDQAESDGVAATSYWIFGAALALGVSSIYLTYRHQTGDD